MDFMNRLFCVLFCRKERLIPCEICTPFEIGQGLAFLYSSTCFFRHFKKASDALDRS